MELNNHQIDICAVSETKKKGKGSMSLAEYILIYSGKAKNERAASGVGLLLRKTYESSIKEVSYVNDRILVTSLEFRKPIHFVCVYAPDISKPQEEILQFYDQLQGTLDKLPNKEEVILLGDLNARIGNEVLAGIKNRFNEETINSSGETLIQFCAHNELRINNTFYPHKLQHKYTFENSRGQKSIIDYIITNRNIHPSRILDVKVLTSANTGTDHHLLVAKLRNCSQIKKKVKSPLESIQKINIESLSNDSTKNLYQQRLIQKINENGITDEDTVETSWTKLRSNIINAAEEALGSRQVKIGGSRNTKPWFTEEIRTLAGEKKKSYLNLRSGTVTQEEYRVVRNRVNTKITAIKRQFWEAYSVSMEHDLYGGQKKIWNMLRNRKRPVNEYVNTTRISTEQWESHFRMLYSDSGQEPKPVMEEQINNADGNPIEQTLFTRDINLAVSKLKNRKSPGLDNINNELIKYGGPTLMEQITSLFNKIYKNKKIPVQWKESITIPLFKRGVKTDMNNYRGISLLSTTSKLLTKIIAQQVAQTGINEEQQGFRQNRSTIDGIFILRQIAEKAIEYNNVAYMCFIDLKQAFDRVRLKDVLALLEERNLDSHLIALIKELNTGNSTFIRVEQKLTKRIDISTGIRQGDSLSPILFNIVMDKIIDEVKTAGKGYRMGDQEFKIICYADDAVIISQDEDNLQRMLFKFEQTAQQYNMIISQEKTQSLTISRDPKRCKLALYNKSVAQVMSFKYLGAQITSNRDLKSEVKSQTIKAARLSGFLRDVIWRNKHMSIASKTRIYKTCVRPVMTYATETRAETAATKRILRAAEMRTLRTITGHTLLDRQRSEDIRATCGIQDVVRWSRVRKRAWRDHVDRMPGNRLVRAAKHNKPEGNRPPGRPPKRWHESWTSESQLRLL